MAPEAIATTKRRFEKVLETLSNPPASSSRLLEPAAKRARRSLEGTAIASNAAASKSEKSLDAPNFSPWSHETFLARLKTFSNVSLWHPKPDAINEVQWAKRGWICIDLNTVACRGGCEKRVVVSLDPSKKYSQRNREMDEEEQAAYEASLVKRYSSLLIEGHAADCYWRQAGCKDDIYRLQVVRPSVWHGDLRTRYMSLMSVAKSIRSLTLKGIPHDETNYFPPERLLQDLPKDVLTLTDAPVEEWSAKALETALHGWRGTSDSGNDLLCCDACFQRVGLWMYQPDYKPMRISSGTRGENDDEDSDDIATIDLLDMHREHCPWRNPETQKATGNLVGLSASQILQRVISTQARENRRKQDQRSRVHTPAGEDEDADDSAEVVTLSKEEVAKKDKERESRLRRLKSLFTIKRGPTSKIRPKSSIL